MNEEKDEMIETLRLAYREKLSQKINDIDREWDNLRMNLQNTKWNDEKCKTFYKMVHQFNGTAGSYSYTEISMVLGKLETYLKSFLNTEETISTEQEMDINQKLSEVKKVIENVLASS